MANTFKNSHVAAIGTVETDVYTTPAATTTVILGANLCNITTSTITVDVTFSDAGTADRKLLNDVQIAPGSALEILSGQKYILEATDKIKVISSAASSLDVFMSVMEIS